MVSATKLETQNVILMALPSIFMRQLGLAKRKNLQPCLQSHPLKLVKCGVNFLCMVVCGIRKDYHLFYYILMVIQLADNDVFNIY